MANANKTPMISPWSTNPKTTEGRPYVFRACFLDPFQGPVAAKFVTEEFGALPIQIQVMTANRSRTTRSALCFFIWKDLCGCWSK